MEYTDFTKLNLSGFCGGSFNCGCSAEHSVSTKKILLRGSARQQAAACAAEAQPSGHILFACADDMYGSCARDFERTLAGTHLVSTVRFPERFRPSVQSSARLVKHSEDVRLIVSYGGGAVTDVAKYAATITGLPHVAVGSSPATDGYLSPWAELYSGEEKRTFAAKPPEYFLLDTDAALGAPPVLVAAGFGAVMSKWGALLDWSFARALTGERYCENTARLIIRSAESVRRVSEGLIKGSRDAVLELCRALVFCSLANQLEPGGRVRGGSEKLLADMLEMLALRRGKSCRLPGEYALISLCYTARISGMYFEKAHANVLMPPDPLRRAHLLHTELGMQQRDYYARAREHKLCEDGLFEHKLSQYRSEMHALSLSTLEKARWALDAFKKIYADAGYWLSGCLLPGEMRRAFALAAEAGGGLTVLGHLQLRGYLEHLLMA